MAQYCIRCHTLILEHLGISQLGPKCSAGYEESLAHSLF